jgi:NADH dehydrogenase
VLVDRRNFHLFQPLLYQVATGALSSGEIASPLRSLVKRQPNASVVLARAVDFDLAAREVILAPLTLDVDLPAPEPIHYDTLVVAAGARHAYFGHPEWERFAPGLKTLEDALEVRRRILVAFEAAENEPDPERRRAWLTFVVVGGGPTGVEVAGQIAEIGRDTLRKDFRRMDPRAATILLLEAGDRVLPTFHPGLSARSTHALEHLGVTVRVGALVTGVDDASVTVEPHDGVPERIAARTVVWAAGVTASPLGAALGRASGAHVDRVGRVRVEPDLTLPGHPEVFAIGDMVRVSDGAGGELPLPGVAQVAMQSGRYVARIVRARLRGAEPPGPFHYRNKGDLATIGRLRAVAQLRRFDVWGLPAWLVWLTIHITYLNGLQNRVLVFIRWTVSFVTHGRGARLITGPDLHDEDAARDRPG